MAALALPFKVIAQVPFKAGGDVFHHLFVYNPDHIKNMTPLVKGSDLHHGDHGAHGAVVVWKYTRDGKEESCKTLLQDLDVEKKQIAWRYIEGDMLKLYKNFIVTCHVETKGDVDFVTWIIDYEMLNSDNPHPVSMLNYFINLTKEIEAHILG